MQFGEPGTPSPPAPALLPCSPIHWPFRIQQLEDGLPIHIRGDVQTGNVQDGGGQVDVEDDVGIPEGGGEKRTRPPGQWCPGLAGEKGWLEGRRSPGTHAQKVGKL